MSWLSLSKSPIHTKIYFDCVLNGEKSEKNNRYPVCLTLANMNSDWTGGKPLAEPSELEAQHGPVSLLSQSENHF